MNAVEALDRAYRAASTTDVVDALDKAWDDSYDMCVKDGIPKDAPDEVWHEARAAKTLRLYAARSVATRLANRETAPDRKPL